MKIVIVTPVWGRPDISPAVIASWPRDETWSTLVVYSTDQEATWYAGCKTLFAPNSPLCGKFEAGARHAFEVLGADYVCIMGSDTLIPRLGWKRLEEYAQAGSSYVGFLDVWVVDSAQALYWSGYEGARAGEPVGPGRLISRALAERSKFSIYQADKKRSCDGEMTKIVGLPASAIVGADYAPVSLKDEGSITPMINYRHGIKAVLNATDFLEVNYPDLAHLAKHLA